MWDLVWGVNTHGEEEFKHGEILNRWMEGVGSALFQIGLMNLGQTLTNS